MKVQAIALSLAALLGSSAALANPGFAGNTSTPNPAPVRHIQVGTTTPNADGKAALQVNDPSQTGNTANNKLVALDKMARMAGRWYVSSNIMHKDQNDVYVGRMYNMTGLYSWIPGMPDHSKLGRMSFAKAGNGDVWFGEWADVAAGATNGSPGSNRTVFYSGVGKTTNLPTSGTATYTVKGINGHVDHNAEVLQGQLTADFSNNRLNGTLSRSDLSIAINNATINTADASFSGNGNVTATGSSIDNAVVTGSTKGHFYGHQGEALAGIATFAGVDNKLDTAFGGTKQ